MYILKLYKKRFQKTVLKTFQNENKGTLIRLLALEQTRFLLKNGEDLEMF